LYSIGQGNFIFISKIKNSANYEELFLWQPCKVILTLKGLDKQLSVTDIDEIRNMAVVTDVSVSDAVFISVINNTLKDFTHVECLREVQKNWIKILWPMAKMSLQFFQPHAERV